MLIFVQNSKLSCVELLGARSLNILFPLCIVRAPVAAYNVCSCKNKATFLHPLTRGVYTQRNYHVISGSSTDACAPVPSSKHYRSLGRVVHHTRPAGVTTLRTVYTGYPGLRYTPGLASWLSCRYTNYLYCQLTVNTTKNAYFCYAVLTLKRPLHNCTAPHK